MREIFENDSVGVQGRSFARTLTPDKRRTGK